MKTRYVSIAALGLLLTAGCGVLFYWSNQPAVSVPSNQQDVKGAESPEYSLKPYSNDYFSASLPLRYNSRSITNGVGKPILLQQLFSAPTDTNLYADQLALTVGNLLSGGIQDLADVQMRKRVAEYTEVKFPWLPENQAVAYERSLEGYEIGVFISNGQRYATIVLTGLSDKKPQLTKELQLFVSSMQWK